MDPYFMRHSLKFLPFFFCLILSTSVLLNAQETVTIHPNWEVGDTLIYTSDMKQQESTMGISANRLSLTYTITQTILEKRNDSYVIGVSYSVDSCNHQESWMREVMSATDGLSYNYIASSTGAFEKLEDWTTVRDFMKKAVANMIEKIPDPQVRPAIEALLANFVSEESMTSNGIGDIVAIHKLYNKPMVIGEREKSTTTSPNISGGEPVTTYVSTELTSAPPVSETYSIEERMTLDQDELVDAIYNMIAQIAKIQGQEPPSKDLFAAVKNEALTVREYGKDGLLKKMVTELAVNVYISTQTVTTTLELVDYIPAK